MSDQPAISFRRSSLPWLLLALMIPLLTAVGWGVLLFFNLALAADPETNYHQWALMHGTDLLWGWVGLAAFALAARHARQTAHKTSLTSPPTPPNPPPNRPPKSPLKPPATAPQCAALFLLFLGVIIASATVAVDEPGLRGWLALAASACLLPAALLFSFEFLRTCAARGIDVSTLFVLVAIQWLLIWSSADILIRFHVRAQGEPSNVARTLLLQLPLLAFIPNLFFGIAIRLLPTLMPLRQRPRAWLIALPLYNSGLLLFFTAPWLWSPLAAVGAAFLLFAAVLYLVGFNFFISGAAGFLSVAPRGHLSIQLAFLWLLIALALLLLQQSALLLPSAAPSTPLLYLMSPTVVAAWHQALSVGFVATFILAAGQRLMRALLPPRLATPRLFTTAAVLLTLGIAWHIAFELLTLTNGSDATWPFRLLGLGACLEFAALVIFGLSMFRAWLSLRSPLQASII